MPKEKIDLTNINRHLKLGLSIKQKMDLLEEQGHKNCKAKILCDYRTGNKEIEDLEQLWRKVCKDLNYWICTKTYPKVITYV